jgi:Fe-S-cluster containining protein
MEKTGSEGPLDIDKRLTLKDTFAFACGPEVPCFTECCRRLDLLVTPYDAMRLSKRLGMTAAEFLDEYTITRHKTPHGFPEVMMRMERSSEKTCPFVTPDGCSVYEDRPGACRIYPIGRASSKRAFDDGRREFFFTVKEEHCRGFEEKKEWTVEEWMADQGIEDYNRMNDLLMDLYVHKARRKGLKLGAKHMQMFMMACYNLERFRDFIFQSGFLKRFDIEQKLLESLRTDDEELLKFAFQWLKFAFFQEPTLKLRGETASPE